MSQPAKRRKTKAVAATPRSAATVAPAPPSPPATPSATQRIFGLLPSDLTIPVLRKILAIFRQFLKKIEPRADLLRRVQNLEPRRTLLERYAVTQLILYDLPITRAVIRDWPAIAPEAQDERGQSPAADRLCLACQNTLPAARFRHTKLTEECNHECQYCEECLGAGIVVQLNDEGQDWNSIRCSDCPGILRTETVRRYLHGEMLERYNDFLVVMQFQHFKNFFLCAQPGCRSGQVHTPSADKARPPQRMTCTKCHRDTCTRHGVPWDDQTAQVLHDDAGCLRSIPDEEEQSNIFIRQNTKKCPGCGVNIQKSGGCDNMHCTQCMANFGWRNAPVHNEKVGPVPSSSSNDSIHGNIYDPAGNGHNANPLYHGQAGVAGSSGDDDEDDERKHILIRPERVSRYST